MSLAKSNLKAKLDKIDQAAVQGALKGFYESRLKIEISIWEKGRAVAPFTPLKGATESWRELERETGRKREDLKRWFELYERYPNRDQFIEEYAKPRAEAWTKKALAPRQLFAMLDDTDRWAEWFIDGLAEKLVSITKLPEKNEAYYEAIFNLITKEEFAWLNYKVDLCTDINQLLLMIELATLLQNFIAGERLRLERRAGELITSNSSQDPHMWMTTRRGGEQSDE